MKHQMDIAIAAFGDPFDRTTWSGAPRNLSLAFESKGWNVTGLDMSLGGWRRIVSMGSGYARFGPKSRNFTSYLWPRYQSARASMETWRRENPVTPVIHTDTMWLPYQGMGENDFLFRDTTWSSLASGWQVPAELSALLADRHNRIYQTVGGIFVVGEWAAEDLQANWGVAAEKIRVVGIGYGDIPPCLDQRDYGNGATLFVAKVRFEQKGGWVLVDAFRAARSVNPNLTLTIVHPPNLNIEEPGIRLLSGISWDELQQLYCSHALFAMPAIWEPWGLVYLEALVSRTPILGVNRLAFPELSGYGQYGYGVSQPSAEMVADALLEAHSSPEMLEQKGRQGQDYVLSQQSWPKTVDRIVDHLALVK